MLASGRLLVLALFLLAAAAARASPAPAPAHRRGTAHDAWQRLIAEYSRAGAAAGHQGSWGYPFSLGTSPVLLLPIPVPVPAHHQAKSDCDDSGERDDGNLPDDFLRFAPAASAQQSPRPFGTPTQQAAEPFYRPGEPYPHPAESYQLAEPYPRPAEPYSRPTEPYPRPAEPYPRPAEPYARPDQAARLPTKPLYNPEISFDYKLAPNDLPQIEPVSSATLIELFRAQTPKAPEMPPALLQPEYRPQPAAARADFGYLPPEPATGYNYPVPLRTRFARQLPADEQSDEQPAAAPDAPPRYPTSLMVKGELTAYKADYTEPYTAWSDGSGAARVDFHGGTASAYSTPQPDGSVRHVLMRVQRGADGSTTRRCMMAAAPAKEESKAPPALPDLKGFLFGRFKRMADGKRAEVWQRSERAAAGGETRARRHELTLLRQDDDTAMPLKYSVTTDSAMLGAGSDRFEHRYTEVRPGAVPAGMLSVDLDAACADVAVMNASQPMQMSLLDPLREFVRPATDALMLDVFTQFTKDFSRKYVDKAEEVLRMNVLMQTWRWLQSFNRQGATFEVGLNFLADRLDAELEALRGVVAAPERLLAELFPHAAAETERLAADLPDQFDWRDLGAVTPPRYQGSCSSCWAFAVTAATEGALHAAAGRLVPLAEQALVDCGNRTGAHGCGGTWPSFAYDYVQETGLPARAAYSPYAEKVLKCRDDEVPIVTRISAHVNVTSESIPALKVAIRKHAPTVVIIDATTKSFIFYKKGILYDDRCGKKRGQLNHAVTAVGWGSRDGAAHFTVKNSWSDKWGEAGFARLQAPANTCGVLALPSYPRLERADLQPAAAAATAAAAAPPPAAR